MAEQKRPAAGQSYKTPRIGVVNVKTGAAEAEAAKGQVFEAASQAMFRVAAAQSEAAGTAFGKQAVTRDPETGDITVEELPNRLLLGGAGTAAAKKEIATSYAIKEEINLKNAVVDLSLQAKNDPEIFKELWLNYTGAKEKLISESNASFFVPDYQDLAAQYGSQTYNNLRLKRIDRANDLAEVNLRLFAKDMQKSVSSIIAAGGIRQGKEMVDQTTERIKDSNLLAPDASVRLITDLKDTQQKAIVNYIVDANEATSSEINKLSVEVKSEFSEESLKRFPQLSELSDLDQTQREQISSSLSSIAGKKSGLEAEQQKRLEAASRLAANVGTSDDLDLVMENAGLTGFEINESTVSDENVRNIVELSVANGVLPTSVKNILTGISTGRVTNLDKAANALDFFERVRVQETPSGKIKTQMGLSDDSYAVLDYIAQQVKTFGREGLSQAIADAKVFFESDDLREKATRIGGTEVEIKANDSNATAIEKISAHVLKDLKPSERARLKPFLTMQIKMRDSLSEVGTKTMEYYDQIAEKTDYIEGAEKSIYAPERFFKNIDLSEIIEGTEETRFFEDSYFDYYINRNFIERNGIKLSDSFLDKKNGNVRLVPFESQSDDKRATYFLRNIETGLTLTARNGEPLIFHTDMLKNEMKKIQMKKARKVRRDEIDAMFRQRQLQINNNLSLLGKQYLQQYIK